ncbi:MAG TPA: hypothetical protein VIJ28_22495 [Chloroflexota bacterium]
MIKPMATQAIPSRSFPWRGILVAGFAYLALAIAYTWPLALHLNTGILNETDAPDAYEQTWVIAWVQHALATNPTQLLNAPIFSPTQGVLGYQDHMTPLAILLYPVQWLTGNPLVVYNVGLILAFPFTALAMIPLAWYLCGDGRAAFLAGIIVAFSPYRERHIVHLNQSSAEGVPLIVWTFERARLDGGAGWWLGLAGSLLLCSTLSNYYLGYTALGLGVYSLVCLIRRQPLIARKAWRGSWAFLLGLVPLGLALLPYMRVKATVGAERRLQDVVYFSADLRDFLHAGPESLLYGWSDGLWRIAPLNVEVYVFPGWLAIALVGLAVRRTATGAAPPVTVMRERAIRYAQTALALGILTLGPYLRLFGSLTHLALPYLAVYFALPGFSGFRDVSRVDQVLTVFLAGSAAIGAARLLAHLAPRTASQVLAALIAILILEYAVVQKPLLPVASGTAIPAVYRWLADQPAGVVLELPICGLPGQPCLEESTYMYYSTYHWHPLVNGGGGFFPADWNQRIGPLQTFPSPSATAMIQRLRVRYIIAHPDFPRYQAAESYCASVPCPGYKRLRFGAAIVFVIEPHSGS